MEVVLVGLPGSGKSALGKRLAERHGVPFVDLDAAIEAAAARPIGDIFAQEGEAAFRAREAGAIVDLGPADRSPGIQRVVASGGGAIVEPRNRWRLFRDRRVIWLDAPAERLAQRVRHGPVRPLLCGRDPVDALEALRERRARFYAAGTRLVADGSRTTGLEAIEQLLAEDQEAGTRLLRAQTPIGCWELGAGHAASASRQQIRALGSPRVAVVSEPVAWRLHGERLARSLGEAGCDVEHVLVRRGERAKTLRGLEMVVRALAERRFERRDAVLALGGGAVGDVAGFGAAVYLRGVPLIHVPTTLAAQLDSSIGGKTAIDLPEGKNLVGAFHQPRAIVTDLELLASLPARERRAALGEAVKMAALGDEQLFGLLEREGAAIAEGGPDAFESGAVAELVERCAWAKIEIVLADEREDDRRMALNLGHSIGHAIEAAAGYRGILHGEAVAYGLRGALAVGQSVGVTPRDRAERIESLLASLDLGREPLTLAAAGVRHHLAADKKHRDGRLQWVLATGDGITVSDRVADSAVEAGIAAALAGAR
ncbi:MAG: iron-containing alcohol dehydrogenase [Chloroflexi bacterium]|nr:iron-containing alcohol dehydrogenase [Chloroflexota bacterium]